MEINGLGVLHFCSIIGIARSAYLIFRRVPILNSRIFIPLLILLSAEALFFFFPWVMYEVFRRVFIGTILILYTYPRHGWPVYIIAIGAFLNALVMLVNGGSMPVELGVFSLPVLIYPHSVMTLDTKLPLLADILIYQHFDTYGLASIGDIFLWAGWTLFFGIRRPLTPHTNAS